jgi:GNAT superfamily N-acetyltransferase
MSWEIRNAEEEKDVRRCWPVFRELRENISSEDELIARWRRQLDEGYRIVFIEADGEVQAVAGFRIVNTMAWGRALYLDDLAALTAHRGAGLGTALLRYVQEEARRCGCESVQLDTGYHRHQAHKAYLRNGFLLECHHVAWKVASD